MIDSYWEAIGLDESRVKDLELPQLTEHKLRIEYVSAVLRMRKRESINNLRQD